MKVVFCIGENKSEKKNKKTLSVLNRQLTNVLEKKFNKNNIIVAYEPIWAIGTGETASTNQAQEIHAFIRNILVEQYGNEVALSTSILYGGSCNPSNAKELFSSQDIDGGLIGGASLNAADFVKITQSF